MGIISSGVKAIDKVMVGGLKTKVPSLLFGAPNLGKTWLCYQFSAMCTRPVSAGGLGKKVIYLDTEGFFFTEDTTERFAAYFKKRWPDCEPEKIEIQHIPDLYRLGLEFGMEVELRQEDSRVSVVTKFPTEKQQKLAKAKGKVTVDTQTSKDREWIERAPLYQKCITGDYGLVIIDSLTVPIKSEIAPATQNFPARTGVVSAILGACYPISRMCDVAILLTNHITMNPMSPSAKYGIGDPWGGANVLYYIKHIYGLYKALKEQVEKSPIDGHRLRRIQRYRYPGLDTDIVQAKLEKDVGYTDVEVSGVALPA